MVLKISLVFILLIINANAASKTEYELRDWLSTLPQPWTLNEDTLDDVLPLFYETFPNYDDRLKALSYWRLGTPYKIFNLGEEQLPDADPIFRLDVSDCTSHILTTMSLAESHSWDEAKSTLIQLHYKPSENGLRIPEYKKRWHYTADRLLHHTITPHVSNQYVDQAELQTINIHLNRKQDGTEFLDLNWSKEVDIEFIPSNQVTKALLESLPDMIGIAFVKKSYFKMGVVMAHEGMLFNGKDLLHAGQVAEKTVIEDFMTYYFPESSPRFDGIMLYEFKALNNE